MCAAALQLACSLLIEIEDGREQPDASTTREPNQPQAATRDGGAPQPAEASDAGADAASDAGEPSLEPPLVLAFIERPEEGQATLRLVDARAALRARTDEPSDWRRTLRPSAAAGDVLDFAWSPDGRRLAVRHETLGGARLSLFAAPEWRELPIEPLSPASEPRAMAATSRYRWSPDGGALAVELVSDQGPRIGGFAVTGTVARELTPVALGGPVETLDWLSPSSLFVIQPDAGEPELLELSLSQGTFAMPVARPFIGAFFPIELRRGRAGLIGASADPTNFVFFWPESPAAGVETAFTPSAYLSGALAFAAEPDEAAGTSALFPIGDSSRVLDTLPDCAHVLAWAEGSSPASLGGASLVCLSVSGAAATLTTYAYDQAGVRRASRLDEATLLADYATPSSWEGHARALAAGGAWLSLATVQHDALVDLRGPTPRYDVQPASDASTARAFSPSGGYLLEQRGSRVQLTVLAPGAELSPLRLPLPEALEPPPCELARHVPAFCGAPSAARRSAARWSGREDVASLLAESGGLLVLAPTTDTVGVASVAVSTCGSGCVTQHEFAQ